MLNVVRALESVGGSVLARLKIRKLNAKQMFNAFNAPGQNGHHAVHHVVVVNKRVIKNVLGELKAKDLLLLIITNLLSVIVILIHVLNGVNGLPQNVRLHVDQEQICLVEGAIQFATENGFLVNLKSSHHHFMKTVPLTNQKLNIKNVQ